MCRRKIAALVIASSLAASTSLAQTDWTAGTGDFLVDSNWSAGSPFAGVVTNINNGGTAQLGTVGQVFIDTFNIAGTAASTGRFELTAGDLQAREINIGNVGTGSASVSGGYLEATNGQSLFVGGHGDGNFGTGTLDVSGGFIRAADDVQFGRDGTGTLNLSGGVLRGGFTVVGKFGTGIWNQTGGVFAQDFGDVEIGDGGQTGQTGVPGPREGIMDISGGVLQASGAFAIGNRVGSGEVTVSGGALALTRNPQDLYIGRGFQWPANVVAGGDTSLRIVGDDSTVAVSRDFLMNTSGVASASTLIAEITGSTHTPIQVRGNAQIGNGTFKVELNGYTPVSGDSWTILQAGADLTSAVTAIDAVVTAEGPLDINGDGVIDGSDVLSHNVGGTAGTLMGEFAAFDTTMAPLPSGLSWDLGYMNEAVILSVTGSTFLLGDTNNDGIVNTLDIDPFVLLLTDPAGYTAAFPGVDPLAVGDINLDDVVNTLDIDPFVALLTAGSLTNNGSVPEPTTLMTMVVLFGLSGKLYRSRTAKL